MNHSVVTADDHTNTINYLEAQNRLLERAIVSQKKATVLYQYMALYYYRKNILEKQYRYDRGSQIMQFFEDIDRVYPGWTKKDILNLKNLKLSPEDVNSINTIKDYLLLFSINVK